MSAFAITRSAEPGVSRGTTPMAGGEPGNDYTRAAFDAQAVRAAQASRVMRAALDAQAARAAQAAEHLADAKLRAFAGGHE
ncbi:hypothetical protein N5C96_23935 [Delftia tsuruhatensis]|uniref:hypothetical protein n=1 Tax=Delftia tsuruhatensis TaxID=180282 RepID=UPI001AE85658|nr:hypothetical protein [Delftia tsuruhatensis]MDH0776464.1 hypothetical protein [Delftia tsuruhatensis]MDH1459981.1 hypothetical protein [Delftia tsuruhatensis]MDH1822944.1 hypothetical protein [Delftia tsuruhatensis]WGG12154.1 hypothetical protein N5O86_05785 [Delftia tsuruhatensis]